MSSQKTFLSALALSAFLCAQNPIQAEQSSVPSLATTIEQKNLLEAVVNISARYMPTKKDKEKKNEGDEESLGLEGLGLPPQLEELFRQFGGGMPSGKGGKNRRMMGPKAMSLGSGFVIKADDKEAIVITNNHVVEDTNDITITFNSPEGGSKKVESKLKAKIIGRDPKTDVAVLKVETKGKKLKTVAFGDSSKLRIGEDVFAIGNPYGLLGGTVTKGIVSSLNRNIGVGPYDNFIQTDASITRGHSGGPLLNMQGEVIGVNTVIASGTGGSEGFGFSAPSNTVKSVVDEILKSGSVKRGWIGVAIASIDDETAKTLGLEKARGALVHSVDEKGPAKPAGLEPGDLIISFDGQEVGSSDVLPKIVAATPVGKEVDLIALRQDNDGKLKEVKLKMKIDLLKEDIENLTSDDDDKKTDSAKIDSLGITVQKMNKDLRDKLGIKDKDLDGLVITSVTGMVARAKGVSVGDVITKLDGVKVDKAKDFEKSVKKAQKDKKAVILTLRHKDQTQVVALTPDEEMDDLE